MEEAGSGNEWEGEGEGGRGRCFLPPPFYDGAIKIDPSTRFAVALLKNSFSPHQTDRRLSADP